MLIPRFQYHNPSSLAEACEIKADLKENGSILAGGTDLIVNMKKGVTVTENLISLKNIKEPPLKSIISGNGRTRIGARVTVSEIASSGHIKNTFCGLATGAESLGSPLVRNMATIGGNIVSARPAADLPPALISYKGRVILMSLSGSREVDLDEFFTGPGKTVLDADEILTEVLLDAPPPCSGCGYIKFGTRNALEIGLVNVAAFITLDSPDGTVTDARIFLGAVGPTPIRALTAEKRLIGQKPGDELFSKAGDDASDDSKPIDDFRGSAEYRMDMVKVLTKKALIEALNNAKKNS
jgi:CO/xanthine dehydrogenase FAD-binding subunit